MKVSLRDEMPICRAIAEARRKANRAAGIDPQKIGPKPGEYHELMGVMGEVACAKAFNVYPDLSVIPRRGGRDLTICQRAVDVKATDYQNGKLLATKNNNADVDRYVMAIVKGESVEIVGWCKASELVNPAQATGTGYALPQSALNRELVPIAEASAVAEEHREWWQTYERTRAEMEAQGFL